ncbi:ABC transporter ATP-binding protein [Cerasibacillus terrae]|uniref:ABC transporter ATP-binding protein n=1 Tax=Cerasibacillus terrae TaxID=2498845 RepID=A0A5C8NQ66_9BACI|nr:ABC transporter ATP-binding protein [Cerasibacillus terrae]TXL63944.1 ABC transporter ATP-binding protein [Cerasibacillus terrae]
MIELVNLTKKYKQNNAVKNLNMFIEKGEMVGLLGPNGAGKSTAISMLSSLIEPSEGDVLFQGKSILKRPEALRKITGIVPQEIALYEDLTAQENMEFFGRLYQLRGKQLQGKITEVLELTGLIERRKEVVKTFSGGMKRRLNIGVAMLHNPEFLIMDEPTVGIDPQSRSYILETVKRLNKERNMTVLYTSHYMEEVEFLCDRIYILDKGSLIASGTTNEIKQILSAEKTIQLEVEQVKSELLTLLKEDPSVNRLSVHEKTITLILPKEVDVFAKLTHYAEQTNTNLKSITTEVPTLEDVFLHLTGRGLRD